MSVKKQASKVGENPVNRGRHEHQCRICAHAHRADIEEKFVNWDSLAHIAKQYGVSRDAIYRHAHVFGLMGQRRRNLRASLERIIEKAGEVEVNAAAVVSAASAYARINSRGEWVERTETVNLNALFERMSQAELEAYAKDAVLPSWFTETLGATASNSQDPENDG
jgi:Zn-dependent peptidase ImmA (M78 family)